WPYIEPRCLTRARDAAKPGAVVAAAPTATDSPAPVVAQPQPQRTTTGTAPAEPAAVPSAVMNDRAAAPATSRSATASLTLPRRGVGFGVPRGAMVTPNATIDRRNAQPDVIDRRATQRTVEDAWAGQAAEELIEQPRRRERRRHHRSERRSFFGFPF